MKNKYTLFRRGEVFHLQDSATGKQTSLRTKDETEARSLLNARNEAQRQPVLNLHLARAYWIYARDKRRAEAGEWRVPEARLHFLDLLGGWPGGFLAQRRLRHKCSKGSYQFMFWLIVLAWQFAACDSLQSWQFLKATENWIERTRAVEQRR
ncbi:MAG TPA: DUF1294 domain-containing protein [Verrucomicrobiae bacterium]|nr:DUF1294 domain-containing protein [Verrucomicrobiae bacterium]